MTELTLSIPAFKHPCEMTPEGYDEVADGVLHQRKAVVELGRRICRSCLNQSACLEFGIQTRQEYGLWGGHTPPEMKRLNAIRNGETGDAA